MTGLFFTILALLITLGGACVLAFLWVQKKPEGAGKPGPVPANPCPLPSSVAPLWACAQHIFFLVAKVLAIDGEQVCRSPYRPFA